MKKILTILVFSILASSNLFAESFKLNNNEFIDGEIRGPMPIISGPPNDPKLIFDQDLMTGTTEESKEMIKKIIEDFNKCKIDKQNDCSNTPLKFDSVPIGIKEFSNYTIFYKKLTICLLNRTTFHTST